MLCKNVLFVTTEFVDDNKSLYPGGLATYTFNVAKILCQNEIEVTVFSLGSKTDNFIVDGIDCIIFRNSTYRLKKIMHYLFFGFFDKSFSRVADAFMVYKGIHKIINNYDLIHFTNWKYPGLFFIKKSNFVIRISSYEKYWDNEPNNFKIDRWINQKLEKFEIRQYNNIIGPGKLLLDVIQAELNKSSKLIPTPFIYIKENSKIAKLNLNFLYVGTLSYSKGVDLLLEIVTFVLNKYTNAKFCIVGKISVVNSNIISAKLNTLNKKFGFRFRYIRALDRDDLNVLYRESEIVIIPSIYDNFPNVALEAMANECIVIASNTSSLDTLITAGENGFIVENRTIESWAIIIDSIFQMTPEEKSTIKRRIRDKLSYYEPENAGKLLIDYYNEILSNNVH